MKKRKNCCDGDIIILHTHAHQKITIIWGTVPKIQSETDRFFCHFGPFFDLLPPNVQGNRNFEKMKKASGDVISLHICTLNGNHMMYCSWYMEHDIQFFFLILDHYFCPLTPPPPSRSPLTTHKIKIFKKWKEHLEILSFYTSIT